MNAVKKVRVGLLLPLFAICYALYFFFSVVIGALAFLMGYGGKE